MSKALEPGICSEGTTTVNGGEKKMASEWEELEKLSKDELIIQLVLWKNLYATLRDEKGDKNCPWYAVKPKMTGDEPGEPTTKKWAEKIAQYGAMHPKDGLFCWCDLMDYGLTEDQAYSVCQKLSAEGKLKVPEGTEIDVGQEGRE